MLIPASVHTVEKAVFSGIFKVFRLIFIFQLHSVRWLEAGGISRKMLNFIFLIISGQLAELAEPIKKLAPLTVTELLRGQDIPPTPAGYP